MVSKTVADVNRLGLLRGTVPSPVSIVKQYERTKLSFRSGLLLSGENGRRPDEGWIADETSVTEVARSPMDFQHSHLPQGEGETLARAEVGQRS